MKREKIVCERCDRDIRRADELQEHEGQTLCLRCRKMLTRNIPVTAIVKVTYAPYAWLKIPAILLGGIGLLGILIDTIETVALKFSFLNMPPQGSCYWITAGALVLLGISLLYKQSKEKIAFDNGVPLQTEERWRSV